MISEVEQMEKTIETKDKALEAREKVIEEVQSDNADKKSCIDELSNRITALEGTYVFTTDKLGEAETKISKYEKHFVQHTAQKSKAKAILRFVGGCLLISIGSVFILACIAALIPFTSPLVTPCFSRLGTSAVIGGQQNSSLTIIGIIAALGVAAIPAGVFCVKPGYLKLVKKYTEKCYEKLNG